LNNGHHDLTKGGIKVTATFTPLRAGVMLAGIMTLVVGNAALAQVPGLPGALPQPAAGLKTGVDGLDKKASVAASTAPITVKERVPDRVIQEFLTKFLPKYPGVRVVTIAVDDGVVTLGGRVDDDSSRDEITDVVKRVEGVRLVLNQMNTDEESMTAWESAEHEVAGLWTYLARKWLLIVVAITLVSLFAFAAKKVAASSETLLAPFVGNVLLRSVVGSVLSSLLIIVGLLLALGALDLTRVVLSILGLAGMVGLAVGFAFRDITENFIASVLLGLRRPFQIGDYITVAGQSGAVKSLNTRATVLVTLEGNHVRIPNSVIFKEIMVNSTASPSFRNSFDVVIPNQASTNEAIELISAALATQKGVLPDPPARALVEALEPGGVRLRVYLWSPTRGVDWIQLMSDAKLKVKVTLQDSGILSSAADEKVGRSDRKTQAADSEQSCRGGATHDAMANGDGRANGAAPDLPSDRKIHEPLIDHALGQPETRVSEEGTNLLTKEQK
jgi:small conductance mechanosensitive channel